MLEAVLCWDVGWRLNGIQIGKKNLQEIMSTSDSDSLADSFCKISPNEEFIDPGSTSIVRQV